MLISAVALYLAFRKVNLSELLQAFNHLQYWYLIPGVINLTLSVWVRAVRWRYFLNPIKERSHLGNLFSATMIGYMANNVFPLRAGEFMRAYAIGKSEAISVSSALATVFLERVLDMLTLVIIMGALPLFYTFPGPWMTRTSYLLFAGAAFVIVTCFFVVKNPQRFTQVVSKILRPLPEKVSSRVQKLLGSFVEGFGILERSEHFFTIFGLTVLMWAMYVANIYIFLLAFDMVGDYQLPWVASVMLLVLIALGISVPSSPGYVGTFHAVVMYGLMLFKVPQGEALGYAIVLHAGQFIPLTVGGLFYFWKENFQFSQVKGEKVLVTQPEEVG